MRPFADTLNDALRAHAHSEGGRTRGFSFVRTDGRESTLTFSQLAVEARRRAAALAARGLKKGDRVLLIVPEPEDFVLAFLGAVLGGFVPVPMFPPLAVRDLRAYEDGVLHVARISGAKLRITSASLERAIAPAAAASGVSLEETEKEIPRVLVEDLAAHSDVADIVNVSPSDLAFLQFTSGSTSRPKGVMVSHGNLAANSRAFMLEGLRSDPEVDHGVSWLPLFHDMGLIGFVIGPIFADIGVTFLPTATFVRRPLVWLETLTKKKGTITYAPNFAFELITKRLKAADVESLDLRSLRHTGCGAEPISAATLRAFAEKLRPAGFDPKSFLPSYGMAESTLAVTFGGYQMGVRTDSVDRESLEKGRAESSKDPSMAQELVSCGKAFVGHEIEIRSNDPETLGAKLKDGEVGQIFVRGPSVAQGYFEDEEKTRATFVDGWLVTGDLGYTRSGELYVCGRVKDLIIVRGRNYYPSDIEWVVSEVEGVRKGAVVALGLPSLGGEGERVGEKLVIACEVATSDPAATRAEITRVVLERFSLAVDRVELVTPGGLPRTSSGKLQRAKTKELLLTSLLPKLRSEQAEQAAQLSRELQGGTP